MSTKMVLALAAWTLAGVLPGCTFRYTLQPEEAARAARDLQRHDETQVLARAADGREVLLRLGRDDVLYPLDAAGEYLDESEVRPADRTGVPRREVAAYEHAHRNLGVPLLAGGLGGFAGGVLLQGLFAMDEPEFAVPLVGPVLAARKNFNYHEECSEEAMLCGLEEGVRELGGVVNILTLAIQVAGLGIAIGGLAAWDGAPEEPVPPGYAAADTLTFTLEPISYGDGGAGGAFTLRF